MTQTLVKTITRSRTLLSRKQERLSRWEHAAGAWKGRAPAMIRELKAMRRSWARPGK